MDRKTLTLIATILGSGIAILDGFVVNLALPKIAGDLHTGFSGLQWVADGYLLSLSALILLGGSLGDIFGRKKIYLIGLFGFCAASLLCGLAPTIGLLVAFRIIQGVFGALLTPGGLAIINTNFPPAERGKAIGRWSAWGAIVVPIGPIVGGYIMNILSWRWIFFINIPLGLVCGYLAVNNFQESRSTTRRHVDYWGAIIASISLAGITYGLIEGPIMHWSYKATMALTIGLILVPVFLLWESKHPDPMIRLSLFKSRNFSGANLMTFAMYGALSGFMFSILIYLQIKMGYSPLVAGLSIVPISLELLFLSSKMGALSSKLGPKYFLTIGPLLVAVSLFLLKDYQPGHSYLTFLLPRVILFGFGLAMLVAPLTVTVMSAVDDSSSGIASGINNAVARVSGLIVVALLGLTGAENQYHFSIVLCCGLAIIAGLVSWLTIQNKPIRAG